MYVTDAPFEHLGTHTNQYAVQTRASERTANEYFFWDEETATIRSVSNSNMMLAFENSHTPAWAAYPDPRTKQQALKAGHQLVLKPFNADADTIK